MRTSKHEYFLDVALRCAKQGTCLRRNYGAILVDDSNRIIATGYTGQPRGYEHCKTCWREDNNIPSGSNYEKCHSVHAEMNAIIQAGKSAKETMMYLVGVDMKTGKEFEARPCYLCAKMIVNAEIKKIITRDENGNSNVEETETMFEKHLSDF